MTNSMSNATIKDIAKRLNISPSTVSRALRDHPDIKIETKKKIVALAKELDYHPNIIAQSLKKRRSNIIGVIVPQVKHFFFASIMSGITDVAYQAGYIVMICQSNEDYEQEINNTKALISQHVAGLLISISKSTKKYDHFKVLQRRGIPLVFFDRVCDDIKASKVVVDDYDGAFKAVEYLITSGYKNIAHLAGPQNLSIGKHRFSGYKDALKKHGYSFKENLVVYTGLNEEDGSSSFAILLQQNKKIPDAIFCVTDPVAIGAFTSIKRNKLKIPDDIALVGFSDNPIASLIDPPLTTMRQPAYDLGETAAKLLLNQIESNQNIAVPERKILKTELIIRKST